MNKGLLFSLCLLPQKSVANSARHKQQVLKIVLSDPLRKLPNLTITSEQIYKHTRSYSVCHEEVKRPLREFRAKSM